MSERTFEDKPAIREPSPLLLGIVGPSGTGKTYSALRLASGIREVSGGEVFFIDTENRRSLHYADTFKFRHIDFGAPFDSIAYLKAIEHCIAKGAKTIVVDSMSHEHEGPGGVLEAHAAETKRLAAAWKCGEDAAQMSAWAKPKGERRRMINTILQMRCNMIFCFRAKEKLLIKKGKPPIDRGFMPIAGEEFVYEFMARFLLTPGADGHPTWRSEYEGEKMIMKLPEQFAPLFADDVQLSESIGRAMAEWAMGQAAPKSVAATELLARYAACADVASLRAANKQAREGWQSFNGGERAAIKEAEAAAKARADAAPPPPKDAPADDNEPGSNG